MTKATTLKQSFAIALIAAIAGLLIASVVGAAEATVDATVTPQLVAVSVSDGTVVYGILAANSSANTFTLGQQQTATNDGNVDVDLDIRSSDAVVAGTDWNLEATTSTDQYTHEFSIDDGVSWSFFAADNSVSDLADPVIASKTFDLRITTPTTSTDLGEHTITVTVLATAAL